MATPPRVGTKPYIVVPLLNYETAIFYVNITFPCSTVPQQAWLQSPSAVGDKMIVRLETTSENLGRAGYAPRVQVQTPYSGMGETIVDGTAVYMQTDGVPGSFIYGLSENAEGDLLASDPPSIITDPNTASFRCSTFNSAVNDVIDLGVKCAVFGSSDRVLRAIPIYTVAGGAVGATSASTRLQNRGSALRPNPYLQAANSSCGCLGTGNTALTSINTAVYSTRLFTSPMQTNTGSFRSTNPPVFNPGTNRFYLSWRPAGSNDGYPVSFTFALNSACVPCNRVTVSSATSSNVVVSGDAWQFQS